MPEIFLFVNSRCWIQAYISKQFLKKMREPSLGKYHVFENIMENGAFALFKQMLHFP